MKKTYNDLASWWPLFSAPEDYAEEAAFFHAIFEEFSTPKARTLLELGSGGGNNASHLKPHYTMTLVDPSPGMLAASRALNPECEHIEGDMRTLRLGRAFDAVFIHDAIMYMTTEADLRAALRTAFEHCRPGGVALFTPDYVRESFEPGTDCGGHDGDGRALRYLEWKYDPDPTDSTYTVDYAFMLREGGETSVVHDRHIEGLFPRARWIALMEEVGFSASVRPDAFRRDNFIGLRPPHPLATR